ncbi:carbon-nitrogen hydrolase family protein [Metallosphaera tengchongensis]|uniref:Carbon-nitrogen hydrolase family protein n=1 Tax=Metallosphaera tengchongensis TaxID=1532350 RepID=A0A6N0NVX2_9CREN|nr:carbon-nitrogen hydrolase family protein [Metallosphaera tengchongensis]QKQ99798.1 carbon-nitrogen hydrolase family protein [Metallosphaera tengchongensis]
MLISLTYLKLKEMAKKHNIEKAKKLIKTAKERGAKLVVLPSLFPVGNGFEIYDNEKKIKSMVKNLAEKIPGNTSEIVIKLAIEGQIHVIAGPLLEQAGPKVFLTTLVISPDGEIIGKYRKVASSEKDIRLGISNGKEPMHVVLDKKYGLIAEDDLMSPEINRLLYFAGSQAVIGTMKAYNKRQDSIKHLAIARTVENNMSYLVNGEIIESEEGDIVGYSPTFITTPDSLIYKEANDEDSIVLVESSMITTQHENLMSKAGDLESIIFGLCKSVKRIKTVNNSHIQED